MNGSIYIIINTINGKMYIGKTYKTILERFKEHFKESKRSKNCNRPLYRAFNKYGIENFTIGYLGTFEEGVLEEKEIYYINLFNTYKDGYNATLGGDSRCLYNFTKEYINDIITSSQHLKDARIKLGNIDLKTLKVYTTMYNIDITKLTLTGKRTSITSIITEEQAFRIKYGNESPSILIKELSISRHIISKIRRGIRWKYI